MSDIQKNEDPVYVLIQQIKEGTLDPKTLNKEARQRCVGILLNESYSVIEMAQLFKTCERTIKRDIEDVLEERKMSPDLEQAKKIVGEYWMYSRICRDRLMKFSKEKGASLAEREQAVFLAFNVMTTTITRSQSLGYLPSKPVTVVGDIFHHDTDSAAQLEELNRQIAELGKMATGNDPLSQEIKVDVEAMKKLVDEIKTQTNEKTEENENGKE